MTPAARLVAGITLITVPTIIYGGLSVLSLVSGGRYGLRVAVPLTPEQTTYFRAGHAHAGVLVILSLVIQLLLDHARLPDDWTWAVRLSAPGAAIFVSGGFFGIAFSPRLRVLLYGGALLLGGGAAQDVDAARAAQSMSRAEALRGLPRRARRDLRRRPPRSHGGS